jgi:hypothetical protein
VHRPGGERLQNQHVERAVQEVRLLFSHLQFPLDFLGKIGYPP